MEFKIIKKYLTNCGKEFAYCANKVTNNIGKKEVISKWLNCKELPLYEECIKRINLIKQFNVEKLYLYNVINALYTLKKDEAKIIWENYFYLGKKEIYYERSVDYRHRNKASKNFFLILHS